MKTLWEGLTLHYLLEPNTSSTRALLNKNYWCIETNNNTTLLPQDNQTNSNANNQSRETNAQELKPLEQTPLEPQPHKQQPLEQQSPKLQPLEQQPFEQKPLEQKPLEQQPLEPQSREQKLPKQQTLEPQSPKLQQSKNTASEDKKTLNTAILSTIHSRDKLLEAINNLNHPLQILSTNTVFSSPLPSKHPQIMAIGEAPGEEEDKKGEPFVGASGQLLEEIFNSIGLNRQENIYITNILPWRPPANRTPSAEEVEFFLPYVYKHIELMQPKILILVGSTAYKALFGGKEPISKIRGNFIMHPTLKIPCFIIFHPSYLLRAPTAKKTMWHDMITLKKWLLDNNITDK